MISTLSDPLRQANLSQVTLLLYGISLLTSTFTIDESPVIRIRRLFLLLFAVDVDVDVIRQSSMCDVYNV